MNPTVQQKAEALAEAIAASEELQKLNEARATIDEHESAKIMLRDLARVQEQLQRKQLSGQELTEQDAQRFQAVSMTAGSNPFVRKLLEAEYAFSEMMMGVQDILSKALGDEAAEEVEEEAQSQPAAAPSNVQQLRPRQQESAPKSKLWTPRG